uniref:Uncharacterized protein n=1 Tax=Oryza rufipogon TaxID=4529 RepID=A0A0E0P137_ORYRU
MARSRRARDPAAESPALAAETDLVVPVAVGWGPPSGRGPGPHRGDSISDSSLPRRVAGWFAGLQRLQGRKARIGCGGLRVRPIGLLGLVLDSTSTAAALPCLYQPRESERERERGSHSLSSSSSSSPPVEVSALAPARVGGE